MHRVEVAVIAPEMRLGAREARHLGVLRLRPGDEVEVFDGRGGAARAEVRALDEWGALLAARVGQAPDGHPSPEPALTQPSQDRELPQPVTLAVALLKGDKLADVVRAATELGVSRVQLLVTEHADAREIGEQKLTRLRRIASEAARQSGRAYTPEVAPPLRLGELTWEGRLVAAHPGSAARLPDLLDWRAPLTLLTGPEGGLSERECAQLRGRGAEFVTLGPRILRAETAPVALLGAVAATGV